MMSREPEKTVHEDLGLTAAMDFMNPRTAAGLPSATGSDATSDFDGPDSPAFDLPEPTWTWRRVAIAAAIVAAAAGELVWALSSRDALEERRRTVEALSISDKAALEAKRERFEKLDPAEQSRLRMLQAELSADASPDSLYATVDEYLKWKSQLAPQESATLIGLDATERSARVAAVAAEQQALVNRQFSEADSKKLIMWLESEVRAHQTRILDKLPSQMRERFESMRDGERSFALMYYVLSTRGSGPRLEEFAADLPKLRAQLSSQAQARWDLTIKDKDQFKAMLADWIRQTFERSLAFREGKPYPIDEQELRKYLEQGVPEAERRRLLALPPDEMMSQLRRDYIRSKTPWKDQFGRQGPPFGRGPHDKDDGHKGGGFRRHDDGPPGEPPPPPPPPRNGEFRGDGSRDHEFRGGERDKKFSPDGKPRPDFPGPEFMGPDFKGGPDFRGDNERKPGGERGPDGDKKPESDKKPGGEKAAGERKPGGEKKRNSEDKPASEQSKET